MPHIDVTPGDIWDWCAYGTEGWPHAYARLRVTKVSIEGEEYPSLNVGEDKDLEAWVEAEDLRTGEKCYNTLEHFVEMSSPVEVKGVIWQKPTSRARG